MSADRREAALRSGNMEARGIIDGTRITIPDMLGQRYRGARVRLFRTYWDKPWVVISAGQRWIRNLVQSGTWFSASLESATAQMDRQSAGPLGGVWSPTCTFRLGDPDSCRKDVSIGTGFSGAGARVASIVKAKSIIRMVAATWPGGIPDGWMAGGHIEWVWGAPQVTGTVTSITTSTTMVDTTKTWTPNEHVGKYVRFLDGAGAAVTGYSWAIITANTTNQLTFGVRGDGAAMGTFAIGKAYDICPESQNWGVTSHIVTHFQGAIYELHLLVPTPFPIPVGDSGIWRTGCDGLLGTCKSKFANQLNHGGDAFPPSAEEVVEPPVAQ